MHSNKFLLPRLPACDLSDVLLRRCGGREILRKAKPARIEWVRVLDLAVGQGMNIVDHHAISSARRRSSTAYRWARLPGSSGELSGSGLSHPSRIAARI